MRCRRFLQKHRLTLLLALAVVGLTAAGCGTEPENESSKPWDQPSGWGGGFPSQMMPPH
jgi:hypothetical protein